MQKSPKSAGMGRRESCTRRGRLQYWEVRKARRRESEPTRRGPPREHREENSAKHAHWSRYQRCDAHNDEGSDDAVRDTAAFDADRSRNLREKGYVDRLEPLSSDVEQDQQHRKRRGGGAKARGKDPQRAEDPSAMNGAGGALRFVGYSQRHHGHRPLNTVHIISRANALIMKLTTNSRRPNSRSELT